MASEKLTLREVLLAEAIEAAHDIEVKELRARIAELEKALEPFATFGVGDDTYSDGDALEEFIVGLMRDRIVDWFGPSDFRAARETYNRKAPEIAPKPNTDDIDRAWLDCIAAYSDAVLEVLNQDGDNNRARRMLEMRLCPSPKHTVSAADIEGAEAEVRAVVNEWNTPT